MFYSAYFPSKNYLDILLKLSMGDPIKLTIYLSKEIKKILKLRLDLEFVKSMTFKSITSTKSSTALVVEYRHQNGSTPVKNIRELIETLEDEELKTFLLYPIDWAITHLKPPSKLGVINYFKTKHLVENAENFFRIFKKIHKHFGFKDEREILWNDDVKKQSLAALKRRYYRMLIESSLSSLGVVLIFSTLLVIIIAFITIAYLEAPGFLIVFLIQIFIFFSLYTLIRIINQKRLKRIKEIAQTEQELKVRLDSRQRTKESEIEDKDLIQLRYF